MPEEEAWGGGFKIYSCDDAFDTGLTYKFKVQPKPSSGTNTLRVVVLFSTSSDVTAGTYVKVFWDQQTVAVGDAEPGTLGVASLVIQGPLTADKVYAVIHNITSASAITVTADDELYIGVGRLGTDSQDTYTGSYQIHNCFLVWDETTDPNDFYDGPLRTLTVPSRGGSPGDAGVP